MIFGTVSNNWYAVYILGLFGYFQSQYRCANSSSIYKKCGWILCINAIQLGLGAFASFAMWVFVKDSMVTYGGNYDG
jgi:hypothetical protein